MRKHISAAILLAMGTALPAQADPTFGFGISIALGGGASEVGLGVRVFSDDEEESAVGSLGVDYMLQSGRLRPTLGVAYLDQDFYVGLDLGYDFTSGGIDFGVSAGGVDTESEPSRRASTGGGDEPGDGDGGDGGPVIIDPDDR